MYSDQEMNFSPVRMVGASPACQEHMHASERDPTYHPLTLGTLACFVTIDSGAKYRISGASVTPARNTGTNKYPTAPDASNNVTNDYSTSVLAGDLSPR